MLEFRRPVVLALSAGELLQWRETRAVRLNVLRGRVWVTRANDLDDHFVEAGQSIELLPGAQAIVEAEGDCQVALAQAPTLAQRTLAKLAGMLRPRGGATIPAWISRPTS